MTHFTSYTSYNDNIPEKNSTLNSKYYPLQNCENHSAKLNTPGRQLILAFLFGCLLMILNANSAFAQAYFNGLESGGLGSGLTQQGAGGVVGSINNNTANGPCPNAVYSPKTGSYQLYIDMGPASDNLEFAIDHTFTSCLPATSTFTFSWHSVIRNATNGYQYPDTRTPQNNNTSFKVVITDANNTVLASQDFGNSNTSFICNSNPFVNQSMNFTTTTSAVKIQFMSNSAYSAHGNDAMFDDFALTAPANIAPNTAASVTVQPSCTTATGTIVVTSPNAAGTQYSIDGVNYQTSNTFAGLTPGSYSVTAKSAAGCVSIAVPLTVNAAPAVVPTVASVTAQPVCAAPTGTIVITSPSAAGTQYSIDGINYQTSNTFAGLAPGTYMVTAKTVAGCVSAALPLTVTAAQNCAVSDLTPIIILPATTFIPNQAKDFIIKLSEILGGTTSGTIAFSVSVPTGYKITMNAAATSVTVTGAGTPIGSPIPVSNALWTATSNGDGQIDVVAKPGMNITGNSFTNVGFHLERLPTTVASVGNIVVNIYPDPTLAYDTNSANNNYSRTITGTK